MFVLLRVVRTQEKEISLDEVDYPVYGIPTKEVSIERSGRFGDDPDNRFQKVGEFFLVQPRHVDAVVSCLAKQNAGHEVQVYNLTSIATCPPGDLVKKRVSAEGILPE